MEKVIAIAVLGLPTNIKKELRRRRRRMKKSWMTLDGLA